MADETLLALTADIVSAHVSNNSVGVSEVPNLIASVFTALGALSAGSRESEAPKQEPAVSIGRSVKPDYIVCLEDGMKLKMLKRHLKNTYDMTPDEYRAKWGLPSTYPMVAPNYTALRKELAVKIGLGSKGRGRKVSVPAGATPVKPKVVRKRNPKPASSA